jgi:hypothetical protein
MQYLPLLHQVQRHLIQLQWESRTNISSSMILIVLRYQIRVLRIPILFYERHGNEAMLEKLRSLNRKMAPDKDWGNNTVLCPT